MSHQTEIFLGSRHNSPRECSFRGRQHSAVPHRTGLSVPQSADERAEVHENTAEAERGDEDCDVAEQEVDSCGGER